MDKRKKISIIVKKLWQNPEYRKKQIELHKGHVPWNKGKHGWMSEEGRRKLSEINKGKSPANRKFFVSKEVLHKMYWNEGLTIPEIAKKLNFSRSTVYQWFKKYNMPLRDKIPARVRKIAGKKHSEVIHRKIKEGKWQSPMKGKRHKKETRERIKQTKIKFYKEHPEAREKIKELWKNPEFLKKWREGMKLRPTKPERKLIEIIKKYRLSYRYTGDGSFWIAGKNPDFIHNNGKKLLIEVAGDYWHTPEEMKEKVEHYAKYGWKTLVLWEHEINNLHEEKVVRRLI